MTDRVNTLILQRSGDHFAHQELGIVTVSGNAGDEQDLSGSPQTNAVCQCRILNCGKELGCAQVAPGKGADTACAAPHEQEFVPIPSGIGREFSDFITQPQGLVVRRREPVKGNL